MQYGHLASIVQLGVGLHVGTALMYLYGEIGLGKIRRLLDSIQRLTELTVEVPSDLEEFKLEVESDFDIFTIRHEQQTNTYIRVCSIVAAILAIILCFIAWLNDTLVPDQIALIIIALSLLPAPIMLALLWFNGNSKLEPTMKKALSLEKRVRALVSKARS